MTIEHEASRTLVKSPPELWAECSDAASLARHIGEFGEITITRLDPETSVSWEGENVSGTVQIEPSAWGTRVTLKVQTEGEAAPDTTESEAPPGTGAEAAEDTHADVARDTEVKELQPTHADAAQQTQSTEEERNAPLEETAAEADPAVEADPGPVRRRWRRLIGRLRSRPHGPEALLEEPEPVAEQTPENAAAAPGPESGAEPRTEPEPEPERQSEPEPSQAAAEPEPSQAAGEPELSQAAGEPDAEFDAGAILVAALDSLGQAHHRPFSRA